MKSHMTICLCLLALMPATAAVAESAITVRATELKKEPYADAETLATLPDQARVEILRRQGGWTQIKAQSAAQGWVRMLSLRLGDGTARKGDSGIGSLLSVARSGSSGTTVATGVRGLSEEDLKNANPNPEELQKMKKFAATPQDARKFAVSANLGSQQVDYLPAPAGSASASSDNKPSWGDSQ
ncbi:MAG: SH3 domain-containing protein [Sulfuricella sp.]|nr:SH3 domain-containing protein [Sulfuricella sp.]